MDAKAPLNMGRTVSAPPEAFKGVHDGNASLCESVRSTLQHNPALMSDAVLGCTFAGREPTLADLLERVRQNTDREAVQHYLLIGPRGSGKTTLLRLLAIGVNGDPELEREWLPVVFAEEEYSICDIKDFFLTVLERMGPAASQEYADVRARILVLAASDYDAALRLAIEAVEEVAATRRRRLLLLVDNIDQILEQTTAGDDLATHHLRSLLQHNRLFMVIGSSTSVFDELIDYQRPLYQFFASIHLRPLEFKGVMDLLRRRAAVDAKPLFLKPSRQLARKVRVITSVTGGNPRLVVALYDILTDRPLLEVMDALTRLMDELTPYYKARMESLPTQQRKVIDALVRAGGSATPSDLAAKTGLKANLVAAQLGRLRAGSWVRTSRAADRRSTRYSITDQIFRIWYQMRYQTDPKRPYTFLVRFYQDFYSAEELRTLYSELLARFEVIPSPWAAIGQPNLGKPIDPYLEDLEARLAAVLEALPPGDDTEQSMWHRAKSLIRAGETDKARRLLESSLEFHRESANAPGEAGDEFYLALACRKDGQDDNAIVHYRRAIWLRPDYLEAVRSLGTMLEKTGHHQEAEAAFRRALEIRPDDSLALDRLGDLLANAGRNQEAEVVFRRAVETAPDDVDVLVNLGISLADMDRSDEAEPLFRRALQICPTAANIYCNLGKLLEQSDRMQEAEALYQQALDANIDEGHFLAHIGSVQTRVGQLSEAEVTLRRACEIAADNTYALGVWGNLCVVAGRDDEAEAAYRRALDLDPDDFLNLVNFGGLLARAGNSEAAESALRRATKLHPHKPTALLPLGTLLAELGRFDEAEATFRRLLEFEPTNVAALSSLGTILAELGRFDEAEATFCRLLEFEPTNVAALSSLGNVLAELGRFDEAESAYRGALDNSPNDFFALANLGIVLVRTDKLNEAEALFRQALGLRPGNADVLLRLGSVLEHTGRVEEAVAAFREAHDARPDDMHALHHLADSLTQAGHTRDIQELLHMVQNRQTASADLPLLVARLQMALGDLIATDLSCEKAIETLGRDDLGDLTGQRTQLALFLTEFLPQVLQDGGIGLIRRWSHHLLQSIEPLEVDTRRPIWFAFLQTALRSRPSAEVFEDILNQVELRLPESSESIEAFRAAYRIRVVGDDPSMAALDEDLRDAVNALLRSS